MELVFSFVYNCTIVIHANNTANKVCLLILVLISLDKLCPTRDPRVACGAV